MPHMEVVTIKLLTELEPKKFDFIFRETSSKVIYNSVILSNDRKYIRCVNNVGQLVSIILFDNNIDNILYRIDERFNEVSLNKLVARSFEKLLKVDSEFVDVLGVANKLIQVCNDNNIDLSGLHDEIKTITSYNDTQMLENISMGVK